MSVGKEDLLSIAHSVTLSPMRRIVLAGLILMCVGVLAALAAARFYLVSTPAGALHWVAFETVRREGWTPFIWRLHAPLAPLAREHELGRTFDPLPWTAETFAAIAGAREDLAPSTAATGPVVIAHSTEDLAKLVKMALPGTRIRLAPGTYRMKSTLVLHQKNPGDEAVSIGAERLGTVKIVSLTGETIRIRNGRWVIENLEIAGDCEIDNWCEHAIHIGGSANGTLIRNNRFTEFNAPIKVNGNGKGAFTDDLVIERNSITSTRPRDSDNPVTFIDVVGGKRTRISRNYIADFEKAGRYSDFISYGAFLKGGSTEGVMEHNVVVCSTRGGRGHRIGLSLGGGGTGADYKDVSKDAPEAGGGIISANIIANCSDVGIYLNRAAESQVLHNLLYKTKGIDLQFTPTSAIIANNVIDGRIFSRKGAVYEAKGNLISLWRLLTGLSIAESIYPDLESGMFAAPDSSAGKGVETLPVIDMCGVRHATADPQPGPLARGSSTTCTGGQKSL